jgi:hypothetical protein
VKRVQGREGGGGGGMCVALHEKDALPTVELEIENCCRGALYLFAQWRRRNLQIFGEDEALVLGSDLGGGGGGRRGNVSPGGSLVKPLKKPRRSKSSSSFQFGGWGTNEEDDAAAAATASPTAVHELGGRLAANIAQGGAQEGPAGVAEGGREREMGRGDGFVVPAGERGRRVAIRSISSSYGGDVGRGEGDREEVRASASRSPSYGAAIEDLSFRRSESVQVGVQVCWQERRGVDVGVFERQCGCANRFCVFPCFLSQPPGTRTTRKRSLPLPRTLKRYQLSLV